MSKSTYGAFKTNETREREGVTLDLGDAGKFRLARAGGGNAAFQKRLAAITKPHRRAIQTETISTAQAEALMAQVYAETVVLGWEGVTGEDGQLLPFSKDNCVKLLTDLPELFREIQTTSSDIRYFRDEILEADAKN